jgi:hypothetical protein
VTSAFQEFLITAQIVSKDQESALSKVRITRARNLLLRLLDSYIRGLGQRAKIGAGPQGEEYQFVPELAYRAIRVLQGLASSTIIVVPINFNIAPTVLTIHVPARNLIPVVDKPFTWRRPISLLNFHNWLIRPSGNLEIDVLLPMADAARQIQVELAEGMSFEKPSNKEGVAHAVLPRLEIAVRKPTPEQDLSAAPEAVASAKKLPWPPAGSQPLADLAQTKETVVADLMRHYEIRPERDPKSAHPADQAGGGEPTSGLAGESRLYRRTSVDRLEPRTLVARVEMIEDVTQHATPEYAIVHADIRVDDRDYFSAARTSAIMSMIVMAIILASIVGWHYLAHSSLRPETAVSSPEVAAIVLTLFVTIQASRMRRPDRTTLKGLLSSAGTVLIAPSVLPSLTLAVALSFGPGILGATLWVAGCIVGQALFLGFMWRGPLTAIKAPSYEQRGAFRLGERAETS